MAPALKNPPFSVGDVRELGSIPVSGRSPEKGLATHSSILAWRIPWTEEPGRDRNSHGVAAVLGVAESDH